MTQATNAAHRAEDLHSLVISLVRFRADGSEIGIADVVAYLDRIRVASAVTDGANVAAPGIIIVTVLVDTHHNVVRADGVTREPLSFEACTRSVLHHLNTIAVFDDAVVDQTGEGHNPDDVPEDIKHQLERLLDAPQSAVVHAMNTRDTITPGFIAAAAESPVQRAFVENFTLVLDPSGKSNDVSIEISSRSELPIAVLAHTGDCRSIVAKIRVGLRSSTFLIQDKPPHQTLVSTFGISEIEAALRQDSRISHQAGAGIPAALEEALLAIDGRSPEFFDEVLARVGLPRQAASWLRGTAPDGEIVEVEPQSTGSILKDSIVSEFQDESLDSSRFLGGFKRFLRNRPVFAFSYGLTEIVLGTALLVFGGDWGIWPIVRWGAGALWLIDGLATTAWAGVLLNARLRVSKNGSSNDRLS